MLRFSMKVRRCSVRSILTTVFVASCVIPLAATPTAMAEDRYFEENGVLFREQRIVERKPVAEWQWEERPETTYREEFTTTFREEQRVMQVPVVVATSGGGPPITRWEPRTQIVRSPVVVRQLIPETRMVRVPVRKLGFKMEERVARVPLGPAPSAATTASRPWTGMTPSGYDPSVGR
jgi:hypothetical protein